jgi:hypothetical protein
MNMQEAFAIFNITELKSPQELKQIYHKLALKHHPDKNNHETSEKFQKINQAYEYLTSQKDKTTTIKDWIRFFFDPFATEEFIESMVDENKEVIGKIAVKLFSSKETNSIILTPSLESILHPKNIFKLELSQTTTLYIPLWHHEVEFENSIIVKCKPKLPPDYEIDQDNNIRIILPKKKCEYIQLTSFTPRLYLKESIIPNVYLFKNQGIPKINEDNIYDDGIKSDIIVILV